MLVDCGRDHVFYICFAFVMVFLFDYSIALFVCYYELLGYLLYYMVARLLFAGIVYCCLDFTFCIWGLWFMVGCCVVYFTMMLWVLGCRFALVGWFGDLWVALLGLFTSVCLVVVNFLDYFVGYTLVCHGWLIVGL